MLFSEWQIIEQYNPSTTLRNKIICQNKSFTHICKDASHFIYTAPFTLAQVCQ